MPLDEKSKRLLARASRALGGKEVADAVYRVRAIVGPADIPGSEPLAQRALKKLQNGEIPSADELTALEIVVRLLRPVVFSRLGRLENLPTHPNPEIDLYTADYKLAWDAFRQQLGVRIGSIGRVEARREGSWEHYGTGFVVRPGVVATNRHVLDVITAGSEVLAPGRARIVFKEEVDDTNASTDIVGILEVLDVHPTLDVVLLKIEDDIRPSLIVQGSVASPGTQVVVVGYPAEDRVNNPLFLTSVFKGRYGVRRAALGEVLDGTASPVLFHDCSTTQGNSGAPVLSMETGLVAGIHVSQRGGRR